MIWTNPSCNYCGHELFVDSRNFNNQEIENDYFFHVLYGARFRALVHGSCSRCHKKYTWYEIYSCEYFDEFEEIES